MLELGEECRGVDRYDSFVPLQYVFALLEVAKDRHDDRSLAQAPHYAQAQQVLARYGGESNAPVTTHYTRTMAVILAFRAGQPDEARRHLAEIRNQPDPRLARIQDLPAMLRKLGVEAE